jgi:hypothetical protein
MFSTVRKGSVPVDCNNVFSPQEGFHAACVGLTLDEGGVRLFGKTGDHPMTEAEWLACIDPNPMLGHLAGTGRASPRKLRLFACGCCRNIWTLFKQSDRSVIDTSERYADGLVGKQALREASAVAALAARQTCLEKADEAAYFTARWVAAARAGAPDADPFWHQQRQAQCGVLRDLYGDLFRPVTVEPRWRAWGDATVVRLARAIYDERRFTDLPILADALEDAGCANPVLLTHCRSGTLHVRGCWAVDLLLENG